MDTPTRGQREAAGEFIEPGEQTREQRHGVFERRESGSRRRISPEFKQKAREAAETAKEEGHQILCEQKQRVSQMLDHLCQALHSAADTLRDRQEDKLAEYVESLADQPARWSQFFQNRSVTELGEQLKHSVRENPGFLPGLFACGFLAGRFLKSSARRREESFARGGPSPHHTPLSEQPLQGVAPMSQEPMGVAGSPTETAVPPPVPSSPAI